MQRNFAETRNINVELPLSLYEHLISYKKRLGVGTHLSFFRYVLSHPTDFMMYVDFLKINDKPKESFSIVFVLGDAVYHWNMATFKAMDQGDLLKLIVER